MPNLNESLDSKDRIKRQLWFAYLAALIFWAIAAYGLVGEWAQNNELLARRIAGKPYISDFVNVYNAGVLGRQGASTNIYDAKTQAALAEKVVAPVVPEVPFFCQAPPNFFVACIPLSYFSPVQAWLLYCVVGLTLNIVAMGFLSARYLSTRFAHSFVIASLLAAAPTWNSVEEGNTSLYLLPPLILFWFLLQRKQYLAAGLATGLLLVKVQYLPFIGLIGLAIGGWRYLAGAVVSGLAVLGVSIAVVGMDNVLEWPRIIMHAETSSSYVGVAADKMQNLRGMIAALTGHVDTQMGRVISAVMCIVSAFALVYMWRFSYRKLAASNSFAFEICAAISMITMLLFSIHTHTHDYMLLLPACLWLYVSQIAPRLTVAYPGFSWLLFMIGLLPILPLQPSATYALVLLAMASPRAFRESAA